MKDSESTATPLQVAQWRAIEAVNRLVECKVASEQERNTAIDHVIQHFLARLHQTRPVQRYEVPDADDEIKKLMGL